MSTIRRKVEPEDFISDDKDSDREYRTIEYEGKKLIVSELKLNYGDGVADVPGYLEEETNSVNPVPEEDREEIQDLVQASSPNNLEKDDILFW
ncbi:MAG: hypothetical protein H8Z69_05170 [Nanohaloarchaea archaeon]|nr:hypothetical protein [Candidatus Nanohaloarchaea archaeon]